MAKGKFNKRKFSVGERVKSVAVGHKVPVGSLGTVSTPAERHRPDVYGRKLTYGVIFDTVPSENAHEKGWACLPCDLEPIYDGNQAVAWSVCAWRPTAGAMVRELLTRGTPDAIVGHVKAVLQNFSRADADAMSMFGTAALAYIDQLEKAQRKGVKHR